MANSCNGVPTCHRAAGVSTPSDYGMVSIERNAEAIESRLPVFASENFLRSLSGDYGWFTSERFVLPFIVRQEGIFRQVVFTSGTVSLDAGLSDAEERQFLSGVVRECRKLGADFIAQPRPNALFNVYPEGSVHIGFGSYRVDLSQSEARLFANLHQKQRNVIRKAEKDGVLVRRGHEYLFECHGLIRETMERQGRPYASLEQLEAYRDNLGEGIDFYLALRNGISQGCAVLVSDSSCCYNILAGSCCFPHNGAMGLLHWTAMRDMKSRGIGTYDFVGARIRPARGSKQESIQRFKSRFGSSLTQGYLWKYPLRPWKYVLYRIWCRMGDLAKGQRYSEDIIDNEIRVSGTAGKQVWPAVFLRL
jgi:hypothetical protein